MKRAFPASTILCGTELNVTFLPSASVTVKPAAAAGAAGACASGAVCEEQAALFNMMSNNTMDKIFERIFSPFFLPGTGKNPSAWRVSQ
jgi:hypothetical protein